MIELVIRQLFLPSTARLSGVELDDEDLEEVEKLEELESAKELDLWTRVKKGIFDLVQRMGFFGILVCASVIYPPSYFYLNSQSCSDASLCNMAIKFYNLLRLCICSRFQIRYLISLASLAVIV